MVTSPGEAAHRFVALDSLRGIAALGVALHHIVAVNGPASWMLFQNGGLFVDFFFVLSGFVIAASYGERLAAGFSLLRYAVLRIGRVWPLHAVMACAGLALELVAMVFGNQGLGMYTPFSGVHSLGHFFTSLFLLDAWIPGRTNFYSGAGWSISVELLLYAAAALAFRQGRTGLAALYLLGVLAAAAQVARIELPGATLMMQRGFAGFALGTACWFVHRRLAGRRTGAAGLLEAAALAALLGTIAFAPDRVPNLAVLVPSALAVLIFAREQGGVSTVLQSAPMAWLGRISYAIYMVHAMVQARIMDVLLVVSRRTGLELAQYTIDGIDPVKRMLLAPLPATLMQLAMLVVVLLVAHFAWRWIEEPARQASRRWAARL